MKEPNWQIATEEEVWKYVAWHLAKNGIETVLVGGAVAAIYSEGIYKSGDLDFVLKTYTTDKIKPIMESIGFKLSQGRHYVHPMCEKIVEFMFGPVGIGDDVKIQPDEVKIKGQTLYIYSPTDCIRDRLASYIHFRARECLDQAVLVAEKFPFNHNKVKGWCAKEGYPEAYEALINKLQLKKKSDFSFLSFTGKIHLITSNDELKCVTDQILQAKMLGFDTETRPAFKKGEVYQVALLQLATETDAYVIRLHYLNHFDVFKTIFENPEVIKIGLAIRDDIKQLQKRFQFTPQRFIDLQNLAKENGLSNFGLKGMTEEVLKATITKGPKTTNWESKELTDKQILYAATDAWISLKLYQAING